MPLVTSKQMLENAKKGGYAVCAFNIENMEMAQAVVRAAEACRAPVILQTTTGTLRYADAAVFQAIAARLAATASVPVAMHLDHGATLALVRETAAAGYTSVMIDGSRLPLSENIHLTKEAVAICAPQGIPVEGELGRVGGKEDDAPDAGSGYTLPEEAVRFEAESGVTSLAVGVGTAHGVYAREPVLNVPLIAQLRGLLRVPLVLHGASGLSDDAIRACIAAGISKVNFATELRIAFTDAVKRAMTDAPTAFDPKVFGNAARDAVQKQAEARIAVCGCAGKADA